MASEDTAAFSVMVQPPDTAMYLFSVPLGNQTGVPARRKAGVEARLEEGSAVRITMAKRLMADGVNWLAEFIWPKPPPSVSSYHPPIPDVAPRLPSYIVSIREDPITVRSLLTYVMPFFFISVVLFSGYECFAYMYVCVLRAYLIPFEARRGLQMPWDRSHRHL